MGSMMKGSNRNLLISVVLGFLLIIVLVALANVRNGSPKTSTDSGPMTPDGQIFLGPTSPPPSAGFSQ